MTGNPPGVWEPSSTASMCASPLTWKGGVQYGTTQEVQHRKYNTGYNTWYNKGITHVTAQEEQYVTFCVPVGALLQVQRQ